MDYTRALIKWVWGELSSTHQILNVATSGNCGPKSVHVVTYSAQRVSEPDPTRFSFENHRVAGNSKYRVLPEISGKPGVSGITRYIG